MAESKKTVRMIARISGTRDGADWPARGETLSVSKSEAEDLIRQGLAVDPAASEENALADVLGVETAIVPKARAGQKSVRAQAAADDVGKAK